MTSPLASDASAAVIGCDVLQKQGGVLHCLWLLLSRNNNFASDHQWLLLSHLTTFPTSCLKYIVRIFTFTSPPMMAQLALHSFISEVEPIDIPLPVLDTKPRAETAIVSQRLGLYEGKEPLVCRRSTVSFQSSMSLGNHEDGISRCLSAPGTLQQQIPAYLSSISRDKKTFNGLEAASCRARDNRDSDCRRNVFESGEILAHGGDNFEMRSVLLGYN
jgi:hypothetical protein